MTQYAPVSNETFEQTTSTQIKLQDTQDNYIKYMFIIALSAIFASIAITYLLTRRSL